MYILSLITRIRSIKHNICLINLIMMQIRGDVGEVFDKVMVYLITKQVVARG